METTRTTFKITTVCSIALVGLSLNLQAQDKPATPGQPVYDMEARKRSIVNLERHIGEREERLAELAQDILTLDVRVEKRVDRLVDILAQSKDSKDSKVSVVRTKEKAIEGLAKTIKYYDEKRRGIKELLRKESPIREDLAGDVKKFDDRIEKRVAQIIDLTKSFTESEDLKKYDEYTRSNWGWSWTERSISDDWRQNRRDSQHTRLQNKDMIEALKKNRDYLKSRIVWLEQQLDKDNTTAAERELYSGDIARNEMLIKLRDEQIDEVLSARNETSPATVSRDRAHELADLLDDTASDVRDDFFAIFSKYAEVNQEREQVANLKANLAARKKWMAEHGEAE